MLTVYSTIVFYKGKIISFNVQYGLISKETGGTLLAI